MADNRDQHLVLLGEIKGLVEGLKAGQVSQDVQLASLGQRIEGLDERLSVRIDGLDDRLRTVEQRSAVAGAVAGGAAGVGIALIVESLKAWLGKGTPHP